MKRGRSAVKVVRDRHEALAAERSRSKSPKARKVRKAHKSHKSDEPKVRRTKSQKGFFAFSTVEELTHEFSKIHPGAKMSAAAKEWVLGMKKKDKKAMRLHLTLAGDISQYERGKSIVDISDLVAAQFVIHLGPSSIKIKKHHLKDLKQHK